MVTVATDGAEMYASERARIAERDFAAGFDEVDAAEAFGRFMLGAESDHLLETTAVDRARIFDLGYFTWVEQQGIADRRLRRPAASSRSGGDCGPSWDAGTSSSVSSTPAPGSPFSEHPGE